MKKIILLLLLMLSCFAANATVYMEDLSYYGYPSGMWNVYSKDNAGKWWLIATNSYHISYYDLAPPHYSLPSVVNSDILWTQNYANVNHIPWTWGTCPTSSYKPPCIW